MKIKQVEGLSGREYKLGRLLGRGGQGNVFVVQGGQLAVKILHRDGHAEQHDRLGKQLEFVRRLSLDDVPVARPLEVLRLPNIGYVMELLTDMQPIVNLMWPPREAHSSREWYNRSGGLRRRLHLLARCAEAVSQLHGKGLVYGDLSPNNVFVSTNSAYEEICLIDTDNLCYQSSPATPRLFTPGYGAPEVVNRRSGVNSLTDAFSLAVLVFQALSLVHPLKGDLVVFGEPELEQEAIAGRLPWIDHSEDSRNHSTKGLSREFVLSPSLEKLARRTFEEGLNDPLERPGVGEWAEWLFAAADATLDCGNCSGSFFYTQESCPWCFVASPAFIQIKVLLCYPDETGQMRLDRRTVAGKTLTIPGSVVLTRRLTEGCSGSAGHEPCLRIEVGSTSQLKISCMNDQPYLMISRHDGRKIKVTKQPTLINNPRGWRLHLGSLDQMHRVMVFVVDRRDG